MRHVLFGGLIAALCSAASHAANDDMGGPTLYSGSLLSGEADVNALDRRGIVVMNEVEMRLIQGALMPFWSYRPPVSPFSASPAAYFNWRHFKTDTEWYEPGALRNAIH